RGGLALHAVDAALSPRRPGAGGLRALDHASLYALRRRLIAVIAVAVVAATSQLLFAFGLNLLYLTVRAMRLGPPAARRLATAGEPRVCVQIPIYNERYVVERVLDAVCAIDWPRDRLEVQVLDDSDDETVQILARRVAHWRRTGIGVTELRWSARTLTEDLDLSYRAQLRGWRAAYIEDLVVPEELPVSIDAYRRQQSRWATGSFQSAFRLLGPVLRMHARVAVKFQAAMHLLA